MNLFFRAGRATCCKKDCRYALLCTKRSAAVGENLHKHLQKMEPDLEARQDF